MYEDSQRSNLINIMVHFFQKNTKPNKKVKKTIFRFKKQEQEISKTLTKKLYKYDMSRKCKYCPSMTKGVICHPCNKKLTTLRVKMKIVHELGSECKRCGLQCNMSNLCCFDGNHVGKKTFNLSDAHKYSWEIVKEELKQCELLCAVCHRLYHRTDYPESMLQHIMENIQVSLKLS